MEALDETFLTPTAPMDFVYNYRVGAYMERYLNGFKDKKILGSKCPGCRRVAVPPHMWCGICNKKTEELVEVSQEGTLVNFTIGHVVMEKGQLQPVEAPYLLGMIKLDGASSPLLARVEGIDLREVQTGTRLRAVWREPVEGDYQDLDHFELS